MKSQRPFRLFDENAKADIPRRRFKTLDKALDRCFSLLWRLEVGNTYTIYNIENYKGVIQITRKLDAIQVLADPSLQYGFFIPGVRKLSDGRESFVNPRANNA